MDKPKPCTLGKRHKWEWRRNKIVTDGGYRVSLIGIYRCACREVKYGPPMVDNQLAQAEGAQP